EGGGRGDVEHAAVAALDHRRHEGEQQVVHGDDVELDLRLQPRAVHRPEGAGVARTGVVDQVVDLQALGGKAGDEGAALAGVGEVACPGVDVEVGVRRDQLLLQRDEPLAAAGDEDQGAAVAGREPRQL